MLYADCCFFVCRGLSDGLVWYNIAHPQTIYMQLFTKPETRLNSVMSLFLSCCYYKTEIL